MAENQQGENAKPLGLSTATNKPLGLSSKSNNIVSKPKSAFDASVKPRPILSDKSNKGLLQSKVCVYTCMYLDQPTHNNEIHSCNPQRVLKRR